MLPGHASPPLTLPPDEMRRLGYQVIDLIVDALSGLRERPPSHRATPAELAGVLHEPVPAAGADPEEVLRQAVHDVLAPAMRVDHPRFFAYVPIPSNYVGVPTSCRRASGSSRGPGRRPRARQRRSWPSLAGCATCSAFPGRRVGCSSTAAPRLTCTA